MPYLNPTGSTKVVMTLYELCGNITNPYFTFKLVNKDTLEETVFTAESDFSPIPYYFNYFTFSIGSPAGLTQGILDIPAGQYQYFAYEMSTQYDLNLNNSLGEVENGILYVNATFSQQNVYTASNINIIPTYMGGL